MDGAWLNSIILNLTVSTRLLLLREKKLIEKCHPRSVPHQLLYLSLRNIINGNSISKAFFFSSTLRLLQTEMRRDGKKILKAGLKLLKFMFVSILLKNYLNIKSVD